MGVSCCIVFLDPLVSDAEIGKAHHPFGGNVDILCTVLMRSLTNIQMEIVLNEHIYCAGTSHCTPSDHKHN